MPVRQFDDWWLEYQLMPFGMRGEYLRAGRIAATIANVNRQPNRQPYEPSDFMPELKVDTPSISQNRDMTPEEMHAIFAAFKQNREKRKSS